VDSGLEGLEELLSVGSSSGFRLCACRTVWVFFFFVGAFEYILVLVLVVIVACVRGFGLFSIEYSS